MIKERDQQKLEFILPHLDLRKLNDVSSYHIASLIKESYLQKLELIAPHLDLSKLSDISSYYETESLIKECDLQKLKLTLPHLDLSKIGFFSSIREIAKISNEAKADLLIERIFDSIQSRNPMGKAEDPETLFMSGAQEANTPTSIPKIVHYNWGTTQNNPREIFNGDSKHDLPYIYSLANNIRVYPDWQHILWVNNKTLIPKTIEVVQKLGIEIREISEIPTQRSAIINTVSEFIPPKGAIGAYSTSIKILVAEVFGGISTDINYVFKDKLNDKQLSENNFIVPPGPENYLIIAKPNHAIASKLLEDFEERFSNGCQNDDCNTNRCYSHFIQTMRHELKNGNCIMLDGPVNKLDQTIVGQDGTEGSWAQ